MGTKQTGLTLIELMIVVSIIGILSALASPAYQQFLLRSKRAEMNLHVDAIRLVEDAYRAEWDYFTACALMPATIPGRDAVSFPATPFTSYDWNMLGWTPDGRVYGQYEATASSLPGQLANFTANAYSDIDGDGNYAHHQASPASRSAMMTANNVY